mmetsp:Transcript_102723/g.203969  ORF Transcript_102723/g.203969 Transcript_102723/m.203969 type:complete len:251 (+) Transcript_102723:222-974(+)|eukprot:CAMPEP_0172905294 /NCGR_PEP_ID=MMETSP1075-20121228/174359_1 /TAXON_ID=2916 /ORGANISM="Ceratium fusus, Strain PA161109" /LENGTH=250 /DNA_ID=CAMNT_0013762499 /DNA_START=79 /DNA_END=831 /DNA_ORIENTATION=+
MNTGGPHAAIAASAGPKPGRLPWAVASARTLRRRRRREHGKESECKAKCRYIVVPLQAMASVPAIGNHMQAYGTASIEAAFHAPPGLGEGTVPPLPLRICLAELLKKMENSPCKAVAVSPVLQSDPPGIQTLEDEPMQQQQLAAVSNQLPLFTGTAVTAELTAASDDQAMASTKNNQYNDDTGQDEPIIQKQRMDGVISDLSQVKEYFIDQIINLQDHDGPSIERQLILDMLFCALAHLTGIIDMVQGDA